jgi:hypothetical protein
MDREVVVSVVTPTRNRLHFLREAVNSVLGQTFGDWEMIVIDDASDDGTKGFLDSQTDHRIRSLVNEIHLERSQSRNRGLEEARGTFVWFLDDDDRLRPTALAVLVDALRRNPRAVAAVGARMTFGRNEPRRAEHPIVPLTKSVWKECLAQWVAYPSQTLFRVDAVRKLGGFSTELHPIEDLDLELRLARQGPFSFRPNIVAEYREHPQQTYGTGGWSVADMRERLLVSFAAFLSSLPSRDQAKGTRIRAGGEAWRLARDARDAGDHATAIRCFARTCRTAPELVFSPLTGPVLLRGFVLALVHRVGGDRVVLSIRRVKRTLLRALGRSRR